MTKSVTIYGIKNCETMNKARAWLDKHGVDYAFHDYKVVGIDRERLEKWSKKVGWETLLNRAGTTFKKLPDNDKDGVTSSLAEMHRLIESDMRNKERIFGLLPESWSTRNESINDTSTLQIG